MDSKQGEIGTTLPGNVLLPDAPYVPPEGYGKKITKERWFEFGVVIALVVVGTAWVIWRNQGVRPEAPRMLDQAMAAMQSADYDAVGEGHVFGREVRSYEKDLGALVSKVDLFGPGETEPYETAVIQLVPEPGAWDPSEETLQVVVDEVAGIGARLLPSAIEALKKAVNAMAPITGVLRPHDKGVAATSDGWKLTYVTYREYDETTPEVPAVYLVLQILEAGESQELGAFNRILYTAINDGVDIRARLESESPVNTG